MDQEIHVKSDVSIFDFNDYKEYLLHKGLPDGLYSHRSTNLQKWAQRLGYKSASSLTMVLRGDRLPSFQMVSSIADDFGLSHSEKDYLHMLVELEKKKKQNKDVSDILKKLDTLSKHKRKTSPFKLNIDAFNMVSQWYHMVIKQLITMPGFKEDYNWIFKKLRRKVTIPQIKQAIDNLSRIGVVSRDENNNLAASERSLHAMNDIPSEAIRNHHKSMMDRAKEALDEQDITQRQISGLTFKVNPEQVAEAKKEIVEFFADFNEKYFAEEGSKIYQLNIQFFEHTSELRNEKENLGGNGYV